MRLFAYKGYNLTIQEEALLLKPFKAIWDRDKTLDKFRAMLELGYIYFMEDARSDYQTYLDREERSKLIIIGEGLPSNWKPDKKVEEALTFYAGFKSESVLLLEDLRLGVKILRNGLVTLSELESVEIEKKPLILKAYAEVLSKLSDLTKKIDETEKAIYSELQLSDKVRGTLTKSMYEDI